MNLLNMFKIPRWMEMEVRSLFSTFYGETSIITKALALLATVICANQLFDNTNNLIWFHLQKNWDWGKVINLGAVSNRWHPTGVSSPPPKALIWKTTVPEHLELLYTNITLFSLSARTCNNYVKVCLWGKFSTFHKGMGIQSQLWTRKRRLADMPQVRTC